MTFPLKVPALKIQQPFGEFYLVVLSASALLEITYQDPLRITGPSDDDSTYPLAGVQRRDSSRRLTEIARFIDSSEAVFPTPVILAANYHRDGTIEDDENKRWKIIDEGGDRYSIEIPTGERLSSIVDGQHRLLAFQRATNNDRKEMALACSVFFDLPNPYQAYLFATVNFNQKKVDKSLAFELYGFDTEEESPEAWSPDKAAVFFCRKLNTDRNSALAGKIMVAAKDSKLLFPAGQTATWRVSTASVVEGILRLFSKAPRNDRADIFKKTIAEGRNRQVLDDDGTPLRSLFRATNDRVVYELLKNYFIAVRDNLWSKAENTYLVKTVGIQALFDVLTKVAADSVRDKDISVEYFSKKIAPTKNIKFEDAFFEQASGKGRVRIRNALSFSMQLIAENDLPENDREEYKRVVAP